MCAVAMRPRQRCARWRRRCAATPSPRCAPPTGRTPASRGSTPRPGGPSGRASCSPSTPSRFPRRFGCASRSGTARQPPSRWRRGGFRTRSRNTAPGTTRTRARCADCSSRGASTSGPANPTRQSPCTSARSRLPECSACSRKPAPWGRPTSGSATCTRSAGSATRRATITADSWTYGRMRIRSCCRWCER